MIETMTRREFVVWTLAVLGLARRQLDDDDDAPVIFSAGKVPGHSTLQGGYEFTSSVHCFATRSAPTWRAGI
jgi:hypothetical protein